MKFGNNKADGNLFFCSAVMKGYTMCGTEALRSQGWWGFSSRRDSWGNKDEGGNYPRRFHLVRVAKLKVMEEGGVEIEM